MMLLTKAMRAKLLANGRQSEEDGEGDHVPVCKLFTPAAGATWLVTEMDPEEPDRLFGLADLGLGCPEIGWFSLAEISVPVGNMVFEGKRVRLPLERDQWWDPKGIPLSAWAEAARALGRIDDDPDEARKFVKAPSHELF